MRLYAQSSPGDTLKKTYTADTILPEEKGELEEKVTYAAEDSMVALPGAGRVLLYGKSRVNYGSMNIEAAVIEIDYSRSTVIAYGVKDSVGRMTGTPVFRDGSQVMEAEKIMYNMKSKRGKIFNALTRQGELIVIGNEIKKDSNNVIYMRDMKCIPCQEADARTMFRATRAKIIPDDKIVTGPMYMEIGGVPTPLALPFGYFPNSKSSHSGIILPMYGFSADQGFNLRQGGFYFGINDRTDMKIQGDIYGTGSFVLGVVNNYYLIYKARGYTDIGYTQFDRGDKDVPSTFSRMKSYRARWLHAQDNKSNPNVRFSADVNFVSNQQVNRFTAINSGQFLANNFQSNIFFTRTFRYSSLSINARHDQASQSRIMNIVLPEITYNVNRFFPFKREKAVRQNVFDKLGMSYLVQAQSALSGTDTTILKGSPLDSIRYGVKHTLPISTNFSLFKYITATPALDLSSVMYTKGIRKTYDKDSARILTTPVNEFIFAYDAVFRTSLNTKVYFDYRFMKGRLKQIRHVMIPDITYSYRPDFADPAFGFYKNVQSDSLGRTISYASYERGIYGGPSIGKQNAVSFNIFNNVEAKTAHRTDTGMAYNKVVIFQGVSIGGSYNFARDSLKMSDLSVSGRTTLFRFFNIVANAAFSPYVYDRHYRTVLDRYTYQKGGLARFTSGSVQVDAAFGSDRLEAIRRSRSAPDMTNAAERGATKKTDDEAPLPWSVSASYILGLSNPDARKIQPRHTLNFSGDLMPTKFWKLGITSGFDFLTQSLSYTRVTLYRDLKCWEARIEWVPFGINKSYTLSLNLKSPLLRDVRIPRQQPFFDNFSQ